MCQTNIYVDRYPDGSETTFQQTQYCPLGTPGRPCSQHMIHTNPVRRIQFGEPTSEFMMNTGPQTYHQQAQPRTQYPNTPPRSRDGRERDDSHSPRPILRRHSKRQSMTLTPQDQLPTLKPHREHRKERIVIVDSPPTPRTPPMHFTRPQVFTAPSSPATPPYAFDAPNTARRGRPIIVDERTSTMRNERPRDGSTRANIGERLTPEPRRRNRSLDRGVFQWESPSSSHTSFDSRARREAEETERRNAELLREDEERERRQRRNRDIAALEASLRRDATIRAQDDEIRRRPAVPLPTMRRSETMREPEKLRGILKSPARSPMRDLPIPRVTVTEALTPGELKIAEEAEIRRRLDQRDREARVAREIREREREVRERERREQERRDMEKREVDEAVLKRLRERQLPARRFSVGMGGRRHRVLYDDGVYRWE